MKKQLKTLQDTTVKTTFHILKWVFFLIFLYISFTIIWGFWTNRTEFFNNIITFSVSGFFAFFMGYFGWRLAEIVEKAMMKKIGEKK